MKGSGVHMMTAVDRLFRREYRQALGESVEVRQLARGLLWLGQGVLLSGISFRGWPVPLAMGYLSVLTGWQVVFTCLGSMLGYFWIWGKAGLPGMVWTAVGGILGIFRARGTAVSLLSGVGAGLTGLSTLLFLILGYPGPGFGGWVLQVAAAALSIWLLPRILFPGVPPSAGNLLVRLELGARAFSRCRLLLLEQEAPPIDRDALVERAKQDSCAGCVLRFSCREQQQLCGAVLEDPGGFLCPNRELLQAALQRSREQLRLLEAQRRRHGELCRALVEQYAFVCRFLRSFSASQPAAQSRFRVEVSARSSSRGPANGDRCLAFPGDGCRFYLLLCDGMGTGREAAREGNTSAKLIQELLTAGYPPSDVFRCVNSLLLLRGQAGAVTLDLAEVRLDTGIACLYKWGSAPSWVLRRGGAKKIGTATPPPGISLEENRETVAGLSLRRGETLILLSDGVEGEEFLRRLNVTPDAPPGELAEQILEEGCREGEDDATAAVLRLYPRLPGVS